MKIWRLWLAKTNWRIKLAFVQYIVQTYFMAWPNEGLDGTIVTPGQVQSCKALSRILKMKTYGHSLNLCLQFNLISQHALTTFLSLVVT